MSETRHEEYVSIKQTTWIGDDGCVYQKYTTKDGNIINVTMLDKWPYFEVEKTND